jgi:hypothetical protein
MNLQELEYTRIELRRALADLSGSTRDSCRRSVSIHQQIKTNTPAPS